MKKLSAVLLIALIVAGVVFAQGSTEATGVSTGEEPLKIGVIYLSSPGDQGYSYMHDVGTKAMEEALGSKIEVMTLADIPEGPECATAIEQLVGAGCKLIFANSFGYMDYMYQMAEQYPDVYFAHCSGYLTRDNMCNYFGRMYQMRYLTGMIAAKMSPTGKMGYVGACTIPEVVRGLNAFTLGARAVNPDATVQVVWTNTWYDPGLERDAAQALLDAGCDVIAQHQDTTQPAKAAMEKGKYAVGYNADFRELVGDDKVLVSAMWNWGNFMTPCAESVIDGTWIPNQSYWGGLEDNMCHLSPISPLVPESFQKEIMSIEEEMKDGNFDVFWGEIKDNKGNIVQKAGEKMSDSDMLAMDYLVEGVIGSI